MPQSVCAVNRFCSFFNIVELSYREGGIYNSKKLVAQKTGRFVEEWVAKKISRHDLY